jgi:hypothetical protein
MPQRLAASGGLVFVEDHMFHLIDIAAPESGDREAPLGPLVTVGSGLGLATFSSGGATRARRHVGGQRP